MGGCLRCGAPTCAVFSTNHSVTFALTDSMPPSSCGVVRHTWSTRSVQCGRQPAGPGIASRTCAHAHPVTCQLRTRSHARTAWLRVARTEHSHTATHSNAPLSYLNRCPAEVGGGAARGSQRRAEVVVVRLLAAMLQQQRKPHLQQLPCNMQQPPCNMQQPPCNMQQPAAMNHAAYTVASYASRTLQHAPSNTQHATSFAPFTYEDVQRGG